MASFVKVSAVISIMMVTYVADIQVQAYTVTKKEEKPSSGASASPFFEADEVPIIRTKSAKDEATEVTNRFVHSMKLQFLKRLGIEKLRPRRSERSKWTGNAVPEYLTEILLKFRRQAKKNWIYHQQKDKKTTVLGIMPYKGINRWRIKVKLQSGPYPEGQSNETERQPTVDKQFEKVLSDNSKKVKVNFHLSPVLKLRSMALAEIVVRQPNTTTAKERDGRVDFRSLVICRDSESNDSCRILVHKPVTRRHYFDIYDVTRSLEQWWAEHSMSSDGENCSHCSIIMMGVYRGGNMHLPDLSDVLLVASNRPIADQVPIDDSKGTERQSNDHFDQIESEPTEDDLMIAEELRSIRKGSRRQRREVTCSLHSWYLDFRKLGWTSWIRYPEGYYANYCSGSCVSPSTQNPGNMTNHAFVKSLYRMALQNEDPVPQATIDALPAACCVPVRLSPINILYRNDNEQWIIREMSEMVVDHCGCL